MPRNQSAEEKLADRIYEASVLPELWPDVLRSFSVHAESSEAILFANGEQGLRLVSSSAEFGALAARHYDYDGGHERTRRLLALRRAGFAIDSEVFSEEEIAAEPLFNELLIPSGFGRGIATAMEIPAGDTIVLHAERRFSLGPHPLELVRRLDALRPHFARSAMISARLAFERARTAVETLSALGLPACAVGADGVVLVANREFEAERGYWTTRGFERLALEDRMADAMLREAMKAGALRAQVRSLPLRPRGGLAAAVLHVVPVRRAAHDLFTNAAAILVLTRASAQPTAATSLLQALFDLSPAEAAVAAQVAAGRTVETIANADAKSVHTVRNQLKRVLEKTGSARQADLARLLAQLGRGGPAG